MRHDEWFNATVNGDSLRAVEKASGVPYRTVQNQLKASRFSAENVMAIAIAYGIHPVGALVDTGYLDDKWAQQIDPTRAARELTDEQLCDEFLRRMKLPGSSPMFDMPIDQLSRDRGRHLGLVADSDNEPLGDDHDYIP